MIRFGTVAIAGVLLLTLSACSAAQEPLSAHGSIPVATDTYYADNVSRAMPCQDDLLEAFKDIRGGSQVVITNSDGKTVGVGTLNVGKVADDDSSCDFAFDVSNIPAGSDFYGVHVGSTDRSTFQVKASSLEHISVSLG